MHGQEWNREQDPTGWIISEKLDGFRAFWDGFKLFSKNGKILPVPLEFTNLLPHNVILDGELWVGYDGLAKLVSIFKNTSKYLNNPQKISELWKDVKFCVFDAPKHPGNYTERYYFASESISGCGSNISLISIEQCLGLNHLETMLHNIIKKKGEGIMLYHPKSTYTSGRTSNLLKVKTYAEEDVKFLKSNINNYSFICEQLNGVICTVKCSGWDYTNPPSSGTVLTVKHSGFYQSSQKIKYPFLLKIRNDLNWVEIKEEYIKK